MRASGDMRPENQVSETGRADGFELQTARVAEVTAGAGNAHGDVDVVACDDETGIFGQIFRADFQHCVFAQPGVVVVVGFEVVAGDLAGCYDDELFV